MTCLHVSQGDLNLTSVYVVVWIVSEVYVTEGNRKTNEQWKNQEHI